MVIEFWGGLSFPEVVGEFLMWLHSVEVAGALLLPCSSELLHESAEHFGGMISHHMLIQWSAVDSLAGTV